MSALHPFLREPRRRRFLLPALALGSCLLLATACGRSTRSFRDDATTPPTVVSVSPGSGFPGAGGIVITGTGFRGAGQVLFGPTQALRFTVDSDSRITTSVPEATPPGAVAVTVRKGSMSGTSPALFTIKPLPPPVVLTSFSPQSGVAGTVVTLTGSGMTGATAVAFNARAARSFRVLDDTHIEATVPDGADSGLITVTGAAGSIANTSGDFTIEASGAPVLLALAPASGAPGTAVTLTGTGFLGATGVRFGGVPSGPFQIDATGTRITTTVPAGAATGPVVVLTPVGNSPETPATTFTVDAPDIPSAPVITALTPAQGIPGTEVTVTGTGFKGVTGVTYGGLALPAARYDLDSPTRLRVRIPDDAQAGGTIGVATATPPAATSQDFVLLPSRGTIMPQPLVSSTHTFGMPLLDYPARRRSAIYEGLSLPLAPVFHAYNPIGSTGFRPDKSYPSHTLSILLPPPFYEALPRPIKDRIQALGIPLANVQILVSSQDYAYDGVTPNDGVYLFRPHYWTDPDAPDTGVYFQNHALSGGIFEADPGITISGHAPGEWFDFSITTHGPSPTVAGQILASGNSEPMAGFDTNTSTGLYSVVRDGDRAAVTLHLLFNDAHQEALLAIAGNPNTVGGLLEALVKSSFGGSRGIQLLLALARPIVATVTRAPANGGANVQLTLTGSGFGSATSVLLNGTPLAVQGTGNSDAILRVEVPAGTTGTLQVESPLGTSDAVALPAP